MADNWADWYSGAMAAPLALPGGGYAPAPSFMPPMSVDDMYQGIYPSAGGGLTTNTVRTVGIDPSTGMPYQAPSPTMTARAAYAGGAGAGASGSMSLRPMEMIPNAVPGPNPVMKYTDRLPVSPVGLPLAGVGGSSAGGVGARAQGNAAVSVPNAAPGMGSYQGRFNFASPNGFGAPVHQLNVDVPADEGQFYADSMGMPVRSKSGTVYTPKGGNVTPQQRYEGKAAQPQQQRPRSLLDMIFGGANGGNGANPNNSGGGGFSLFNAIMGGGGSSSSSFGTSPSQGLGMVVDPNTSTGSTLESLGYASGGAVPAAAIRSLSERGYI